MEFVGYCWSMIFSENRHPSRIESGTGFFGIMLKSSISLVMWRSKN